MILERDSSILGIHDEIVRALNADHHQVCKYASIDDKNYVTVKNILRIFLNQYHIKDSEQREFIRDQELLKVQKLLGVSRAPDDDQEDFHKYYMPGSCQGFIAGSAFQRWVDNVPGSPSTIWINGPSGVGKSVLASAIIRQLKDRGLACQFFYFRLRDQEKRSLDKLFKSLAYQVAKVNPEFRTKLSLLSQNRERHRMGNAVNVWRLFQENLFGLDLAKPIYWVIDAIDECSSPAMLLKIMAPLFSSAIPVRIMFFSRHTDLLETSFKELAPRALSSEFKMQSQHDDLARYVRESIKKIQLTPEAILFGEEIGDRIIKSSEGNFLWTRLVVERVLRCRRQSEIDHALKELPPQLESLYQRMEDALTRTLAHPDDAAFTRKVLIWILCCRRHLTIDELSRALQPDAGSILNLSSYIDQVCGGFVIVDRQASQVAVVHHSAQHYLTRVSKNFRIDISYAHTVLFERCMRQLLDLDSGFLYRDLPPEVQLQRNPLLQYAASSWYYHLLRSEPASVATTLELLADFLSGPCNLIWIAILASRRELRDMVKAAEALDSFLMRHEEMLVSEPGKAYSLVDYARTVHCWAIDLVRIAAKFGDDLVSNPRAIYHEIQPFCPAKSAIHKSTHRALTSSQPIAVAGLTGTDWDDCLARFSVRKDCRALKILCVDDYFAVSTTTRGQNMEGSVIVYRTGTCEEMHTLPQGEPVDIMQFSASLRLIATSSRRSVKVWTMPMDPGGDVRILCTLPNPGVSKLLALAFTPDDQNIVVCSFDGVIRRRRLSSSITNWDFMGLVSVGSHLACGRPPSCAAFNHDASLLAVGFRGLPMAIWELAPFRLLQEHRRNGHMWTGVVRVEWNIARGHVMGIYDDGCVFKWDVTETGQVDEAPADAINMKCNLSGDVFVTSCRNSRLAVWDFEHFHPVYELSLPAGVVDVAIDPDGCRIYDLRESYCTIWQPISLVARGGSLPIERSRLDLLLGFVHESQPPGSVVKISADITALTAGHKSAVYCAGNMSGELWIGNADGEISRMLSSFKCPVELVAWSWDDKYLAIAKFGSSISVIVAESATTREGKVLDEKLDAPARQLLFNKSSNLLFVVTAQFLYIWAIEEPPRLVSRRPAYKQCLWVNHPGDNQLLLGLSFDTLSALRWQDLSEEYQLNILPVAHAVAHEALASDSLPSIYKIFSSHDGSLIFLQTSPLYLADSASNEFFVLHDVGIYNSGQGANRSIRLVPLPRHLQALIHVPLGFVNVKSDVVGPCSPSVVDATQNYLAFLSNEGWMSTMYLGGIDIPDRVRSHYFLPTDWLVEDALELAQVNDSGTLFCPKSGEIGIVWQDLGNRWASI
jgi:WD40 repeat protein